MAHKLHTHAEREREVGLQTRENTHIEHQYKIISTEQAGAEVASGGGRCCPHFQANFFFKLSNLVRHLLVFGQIRTL